LDDIGIFGWVLFLLINYLPPEKLLNSCKEGRPMVKTEKLLEQAMSRETEQGSRELEFAS
jgi:hypothetical protein